MTREWQPRPAADRDFPRVPDPRVITITVRLTREAFNALVRRAAVADVSNSKLASDYLHSLLTS